MARGRMLNKKISKDKEVAAICNELGGTSALVYTWLIAHLDVWGRAHADPEMVKSEVVPRFKEATPEMIKQMLEFAADRGLIVLYESGGDRFLWYPKFMSNQAGLRRDREKSDISPPPLEAVLLHNISPNDAGVSDPAGKWREGGGITAGSERDSGGSLPPQSKVNKGKLNKSKLNEEAPAVAGVLLAACEAAEDAWPGELPLPFLRKIIEDYPALDIAATIRDASTWEGEIPKRRKKRHSTFLRNWCRKAARDITSAPPRGGTPDDKTEFDRLLQAQRDRRRDDAR